MRDTLKLKEQDLATWAAKAVEFDAPADWRPDQDQAQLDQLRTAHGITLTELPCEPPHKPKRWQATCQGKTAEHQIAGYAACRALILAKLGEQVG